MKILVIQLARLGDILQTWPTLRAIRRQNPEAEIHFMVRPKFKEAAIHCEAIDKIIDFDSKKMLAPCFSDQENELVLQESIDQVDALMASVDSYYDQIINLSYSPVSSYLNFLLKDHSEDLRGYGRFSDGYLSILDQASAYFYAQVGADRSNQLHLTDIFAATAGLVLEVSDFKPPARIPLDQPRDSKAIAIHVGASDASKNCSSDKWHQIICELAKVWDGNIYLLGTASESLQDRYQFPNSVVDLCGKTDFKDLFQIIQSCQGLVACDSMLIQMANLCDTPAVNLSHTSVSFWETGPRIGGSRIIKFNDSARIQASEVACVFMEMLRGTYLFQNTFCVAQSFDHEAIVGPIHERQQFQWDLTKALYFEASFPVVDNIRRYKAFNKMEELSVLGLEQVAQLRKQNSSEVAAGILAYIDDLMDSIAKIEKSVSPVVRWFNSEKLRVGPGSLSEIIDQTETLFKTLSRICSHYVISDKNTSKAPPEAINGSPEL